MVSKDKIDFFFLSLDANLRTGLSPKQAIGKTAENYKNVFFPDGASDSMKTDIQDAGHDGGVEIFQSGFDINPDGVFLDEDDIAKIIKIRFGLDTFSFSDLITAIELFEMQNASPVSMECMHCKKMFYRQPRTMAQLERWLDFPVGECPACEHAQTLMADEEIKQHLAVTSC